MRHRTCYIVGAGDCRGLGFSPDLGDLVIAADGGLEYLVAEGITPDIVLGDFDSLSSDRDLPQGAEIIRMPREKDETDTYAAALAGIDRGCNRFIIYGGTGGRLSHTFANVQTLSMLAARGVRGYLMGDGFVATVVCGGSSLLFPEDMSGYISLFSLGDRCEGVTVKGLKYELTGADLTNTYPVGVSNEFNGRSATVELSRGMLLAIYAGRRTL